MGVRQSAPHPNQPYPAGLRKIERLRLRVTYAATGVLVCRDDLAPVQAGTQYAAVAHIVFSNAGCAGYNSHPESRVIDGEGNHGTKKEDSI